MRRQGIGPARGSLPNGLVERLLVLGLGLLVVLAIEFTPLAGLRDRVSAGTAPQAAATAVSTSVPPTAPPATTAPTATAVAEAPAPAAAPAASGPAAPPTFPVVAGGDGANLRTEPSRSAPVVVSVRDGTLLTDLNEARTAEGLQWQHVAAGNLEGWVAAELVTPVE